MIADAYRKMVAAGMSTDDIAEMLEIIERGLAQPAPTLDLTPRQARNRRYYEAKASEKRLKASETSYSDAKVSETKVSPKPPSKTQPSKLTPSAPLTGGPHGSDGFDEFWLAWPDKRDKGHARKAYGSALRKAPPEVILAGVANVTETSAWRGGHRVHASTWLNGERWNDEPEDCARAPPAMSFAMMDAVNEELGYRMAREAINDRRNGNTGRNQGTVVALPGPEARAEGPRQMVAGFRD